MSDLSLWELEKEGRYIEVCDARAEGAFQEIVENDLSPNIGGGRPTGQLLWAMSCALRGSDRRRAVFLQGLIETRARNLQTDVDGEVYEQAHRGAAEEWIADSYLLLQSEEATRHYDQAETYFDEASPEGALTWAMETGHEHAAHAIRTFAEFEGHAVDGGEISNYGYQQRLKTKRDLLSMLLTDTQ